MNCREYTGRGDPGERPVGKQLVSQGRDGSSLGEVSGYQRVLEDESEAVRRENQRLIPALHRRKQLGRGKNKGEL